MKQKFDIIESTCVPLPLENVDTETRMLNPDYAMIARAYGISCVTVEKREQLDAALEAMFADDKPFLLDVHVLEEGMVMPMVPPGKGIHQIMITEKEWYNG